MSTVEPVSRARIEWSDAWQRLGGSPGPDDRVNITDRVLDRHVRDGRGATVALRWFGRDDIDVEQPTDVTYAALAQRVDRFAAALTDAGLDAGHGVATLLGRVPELYVAALGTFKAGGVYSPLFSAFGPEPIAQRMRLGKIAILVTTPLLFRRRVVDILDRLPDLRLVVIVGAQENEIAGMVPSTLSQPAGTPGIEVRSFDHFGSESGDDAVPTRADTPALVHFTSGTTGLPKGAVHVHGAVVSHHATAGAVLDLREGDTYWCTADPGWVTGTSYGIIAPLAHGATAIVDEADFDARRWYRIIAEQRVNVLYTAPTAIRMLARAGADLAPPSFPSLRLVASVGEPLDATAVEWARDVFGVPVIDSWWQTETGAIMIAGRLNLDVQPGSMGQSVPGIDATLLERTADGDLMLDEHGQPREVETGDTGEIALRVGWPSMFRGYLGRDDKYRAAFVGSDPQWYRSGDLARRDAVGNYWFIGRGDDVIKTAGHLIGPFEVEAILDEHEAVVESGVIGKPDPTAGAIIKAFVVLHSTYESSDELHTELLAHCRRRLGAAVSPREIEFTDALPHTRSGKIMRRVLKARELGEDEGDTSTLEATPGITEAERTR